MGEWILAKIKKLSGKGKRLMVLVVFFGILPMLIPAEADASPTTRRLAGYTQYDTAAAIAREGWTQSGYAVLAYGENFPDALASVPLARKYNAPVLLSEERNLTDVTKQTLLDLGVKNVFIVGGTAVIAAAVEDQLQEMEIQTVRLAGYDRYDTSVEIAQQLGSVQEIFVTGGDDYADALSVSAPGALRNAPLILVPQDYLPESIQSYLSSQPITKTYLVGGSEQISEDLAGRFPNAERISGTDKYARNIAVLKKFDSLFTFDNIFMATGNAFADALAGSAYAAAQGAPLVLTDSNYNSETGDYLLSKSSVLTQLVILGGEAVMPSALIQAYTDALVGEAPAVTYSAAELAKAVSPSVVHIQGYDTYGVPIVSGSGFIVDATGKIATSYQLLKDTYSAKVTTNEGAVYNVAKVCAYDIKENTAVLKIDASGLQPVTLGDSDRIGIGEKIYTLGNYAGASESMSDGMISTKAKVIENVTYIQITAAVSSKDYGGLLLNEQAEAIGMTAAVASGGESLNLALPVNTLKKLFTQDLDLALAQMPRTSTTDSSSQKKSDQEFANLLNSQYASMTIDGITVRFTWKVNDYSAGSADVSVHGLLDVSDINNWVELIDKEKRGEMMLYFGNLCGEIKLNYPDTSFMGNVLYQNYYYQLPAAPYFPSNEVTYTSDGKWYVSHPVVTFYDLYTQGKSDTRVSLAD